MPTIYKISPDEITTRRVDPWHYQPKFARQIEKIGVHLGESSLFELIDKERDVAGGATPLGANYLENGRVRFYRTSEVDELQLDRDAAVFISDEDDQKLARSRLAVGDVVLTITGAKFGKSAVVTETHLPGNISQHSVRFSPDTEKLDPYFLVAYLNGPTGQIAIWREAYGATRPAIDFPSVRSLIVPSVGNLVQKYIGDKVRQAERLRAWAASAQEETVREMPAYKPMISHYAECSYRVSPDILLSARLDSSFFHPDHRALDSKMKESGCQYFGKVAFAVKPGWNKKSSDSFLYYEIGGLNVSNGTIVPVETLTSEAPSRATTAVKHGDVLVSTVRPNRKNVGFVIEDAQDIPMVATSGFSVIRFESLVDAAFYHAWLRTDDATSQLMRWNSGSAYPAIDEDVPLQIFVPEFDASLRERLGQTLLDTHFALLHSAKLTNAAKLLVEDLIEGQITEAQLIAAEQALQAGNDALDRKILSRLKADGIDGKGPALFSELDELYRLLALAEVE